MSNNQQKDPFLQAKKSTVSTVGLVTQSTGATIQNHLDLLSEGLIKLETVVNELHSKLGSVLVPETIEEERSEGQEDDIFYGSYISYRITAATKGVNNLINTIEKIKKAVDL